jgi:hypothetical protein
VLPARRPIQDIRRIAALALVSGRATRADVELLQQLGVRSLEKGPSLKAPELLGLVYAMRPGFAGVTQQACAGESDVATLRLSEGRNGGLRR